MKAQIVNTLGLVGHMISVTTTQPCCYSVKTAIDNTELIGCAFVPIKLHLQKQAVGWIWPVGNSLSTPLNH